MKKILAGFFLFLAAIGLYILSAPNPSHRAQRIFFGYIFPPFQKIAGYQSPQDRSHLYGFAFEKPLALRPLKEHFGLEEKVKGASNDFESHVILMHWVRDQFRHGTPNREPHSQAFNGYDLLTNGKEDKYLCGTASQLLIQAITSLGEYARRVELRFTPSDAHAVVEAWSSHYNKWVVLDPDFDIYYTVDDVPQNAIELHQLWAANRVAEVEVHFRESPHNIYLKQYESENPALIRSIFETGDGEQWDGKVKEANPTYRRYGKFSVKLLHLYSHVSYPLRNDWVSRPLKWWHPEGNHVQNSLVVQLDTMRNDEDFLHRIFSSDNFYQSPL